MHSYKIVLAASAVLLASTSLSSAAVIADANGPQSFSATVNWGGTLGSPTQVLSFAGFNVSLGTLTQVDIAIKDSITGYVDIFNASPTVSSSVSAGLSNTMAIQLPTVAELNIVLSSSQYTNPALGPLVDSGHQTVSGSTAKNYTATSSLGTYTSAWNILVSDHGQQTSSSNPATGSVTYNDTGGVIATVTYEYTPTPTTPAPEPATMAMLGTGLAGLGLLRRRRKSA